MGVTLSTVTHGFFNKSAHDRSLDRIAGKHSRNDKKLLAQWQNATSWDRILELNRAYLRRELEFTPYYAGPIHDETLPLVPGLLELHDYGFLPYSSQPACDDGPREIDCPCCDKKEMYVAKQRPFLSFLAPGNGDLIPAATLKDFIDALMKDDDFYASVLLFDKFCRDDGCVQQPQVLSNFPEDIETHLHKRTENAYDFENMDWEKKCFIEPYCTCIMRCFQINPQVCPVVIHILAKTFDEADLAGDITRVAEQAGVAKKFAM